MKLILCLSNQLAWRDLFYIEIGLDLIFRTVIVHLDIQICLKLIHHTIIVHSVIQIGLLQYAVGPQ